MTKTKRIGGSLSNSWDPLCREVGGNIGLDWESPFHCCEVSRQKPSKETKPSSRATLLNKPDLPLGAISSSGKNMLPPQQQASLRPHSVSSERAPLSSGQDVRLINQEQSQNRPNSSNGQVGRRGLSVEEKDKKRGQLEKLLGSLNSLDS